MNIFNVSLDVLEEGVVFVYGGWLVRDMNLIRKKLS